MATTFFRLIRILNDGSGSAARQALPDEPGYHPAELMGIVGGEEENLHPAKLQDYSNTIFPG